MNLVSLVGHPCSGKSTLAETIGKKFGVICVSGSQLLKDSIQKLDWGERPKISSREEMNTYHIQWRTLHGISAMADYVVNLSKKLHPEIVCFENLRNFDDAQKIKQFGGLIVALHCPIPERFRRSRLRERPGDNLTLEKFIETEREEYDSDSPYGSHVSRVMEFADINLDSSLSIEIIRAQFIEGIATLGIELK